MLRLGCTVFSSGFNSGDWRRENPICPKCGGRDSAEHFLLHCPETKELRAELERDAYYEFTEQEDQRRETAMRHGRAPPEARQWRGLRQCVVGLYPKSVLRFISRQHLWLDRVARREWCDEGED